MKSIAIFLGSASDLEIVRPCMQTLAQLEIGYSVTVTSAHRTPERTEALVKKAELEGVKVFICAAGMAAHLAGAVAARTIKPVIGIPIMGKALCGMDALFSTVEMPPGFPVATVALDGAKNAALLAAQILALQDDEIMKRLAESRNKMKGEIEASALAIEAAYGDK